MSVVNKIVLGTSFNPWLNLALEELLFDQYQKGMTFYLWQNQHTVVIGKFQNAWKECKVTQLEDDGGKLARRSSGGGAVYHDLGNLNFTFITNREQYNVHRQLSVIQNAVAARGVKAVFTGRNDLTIDPTGEKFSGNAFRLSQTTGMHHGTILVNVDMSQLSKFLVPSKEKLASKGVESVRARVKNIADLNPEITIPGIKYELIEAFIREYGDAEIYLEDSFASLELKKLEEKYTSWEWRLGRTPEFDLSLENRFSWGDLSLNMCFENAKVADVKVYSDSMDEAFIEMIGPALMNSPMDKEAFASRIEKMNHANSAEIAEWLRSTDI